MSKAVEALQLELKDTFSSLGCVVVRGTSTRNGDVRILFSVKDDNKWMKILNTVLETMPTKWYTFLGQKYMKRNGQLGRAWVGIFDAGEGNLDEMVQDIRKCFLAAVPRQKKGIIEWEGEELSVPLPWSPLHPKGDGR